MLAFDLFKEVAELRKKVDELAKEHEAPVLRELPMEEVRVIVRDRVDGLEKGETIYPSDIAFEFGILPELVESALDELAKEGTLGTGDKRKRGRRSPRNRKSEDPGS